MKTTLFAASLFARHFVRFCCSGALWLALAGISAAADVGFVALLKGQQFTQSGQDWASLRDEEGQDDQLPLVLEAIAHGVAADSLVSGTVQIPGGGTVPMSREFPGDSELFGEYGAESLSEFDASKPNGTYIVNLITKNDGARNVSLTLAGDAYPVVPLITNYNTLQAISAAAATVVQWSPMTGGTTDDFIQLSIFDQDTGNPIYHSGMPVSPGALDGTAVQTTIPANTLQPGRSYEAELVFVKTVAMDFSYTKAFAGYYKLVNFNITTNPLVGNPLGSTFEQAIPQAYSGEVPRDSAVSFRFSKPMAPHKSVAWTINSSPVNSTDFSYEWIDGNKVLLCRYNTTLPANAAIGWMLDLSGFRDAADFALSGSESGSFQTGTADPSSPPDVEGLYVIKVRGFRQTGASPASTGMWGCDPGIDLPAFNRVKSANLTVVANGRSVALPQQPWDNSMGQEATYASQADLDRFFANGDFTFAVTTVADGPQSVTLGLGTADDYPAAPTVTNLATLQSINRAVPTTITWNALPGWSQNPSEGSGMIELEIENSAGNEVLWVDNEELANGTQFTIPADALWPGRTYRVNLTFTRIKDLDVSSYPGAFAGAGFSSTTEFTITTSGAPLMPALTLERVNTSMHATAMGGETNREYVLETSSDMQRWLPQATMWLGGQSNTYQDGDAYYLKNRFYRLRDRAPNEHVQPNVAIQGTVWIDNTRSTPASGAVVGTSLDGRTTVTDTSGQFFLETGTKSNYSSAPYTINVTSGANTRNFGPGTWGDQPRGQNFEMN